MFKLAKPFFMIVETPLHAGSGQDLGIVDMPIQRERHTSFPKIEGSGLKGSVREVFEERANDIDERKRIHTVFGYDDSEKDKGVKDIFKENKEFQGALGFTDARTLLFPVKSMKGIFAWITCPKVLDRFKRDLELAKIKNIPAMPAKSTAPDDCQLFRSEERRVGKECRSRLSPYH